MGAVSTFLVFASILISRMEKITVLLLIAALAGSEASSLFRASKGACPVVTTKPNFQIDRYLGNWYEIQKLSNNFQAGMECNMATYALTGPTSISVFNSGMYEDGSPTNITGSAQQDLPDEPGHLTPILRSTCWKLSGLGNGL